MTDYESPDRGTPAWRLVTALAVVAALAAALVLVSRAEETRGSETPLTRSGSTPPATDTASARQREQEVRAQVLAGTEAALHAWGRFAATGDIAAVDDDFWLEGPQRAQLAAEAPGIRDAPPGPPPYEFTLNEGAVVTVTGDVAEVVGTVTVSRPGAETAAYDWTLEMRWEPVSGRWRLWTVSASDR